MRKFARIFVHKHLMCSENGLTIFRECTSSRKYVALEEQVINVQGQISKCTLALNGGLIVFIFLQMFFATNAGTVENCLILYLHVINQTFPNFSWGLFGHVTC